MTLQTFKVEKITKLEREVNEELHREKAMPFGARAFLRYLGLGIRNFYPLSNASNLLVRRDAINQDLYLRRATPRD